MSIESFICFGIVLCILAFMSSYTYFRNKIGKPVESKWASRKFIATVVSVVYTLVAILGLKLPETQIILVDTIIGLYIGIQGYLDVKKVKAEPKQEA